MTALAAGAGPPANRIATRRKMRRIRGGLSILDANVSCILFAPFSENVRDFSRESRPFKQTNQKKTKFCCMKPCRYAGNLVDTRQWVFNNANLLRHLQFYCFLA